MKKFIVTGIGTDIGKTVVSSILAEALKATYWKPVQAGDLDNSDSIKIKKWCSESVQVLPEAFRLTQPLSPHSAAEIDHLKITANELVLPQVDGNFILEGAGGIMVPFNQEGLLFVDLIPIWNIPVILVSRHYLGSINHTLLTAEILQNRGVKIEGVIFVGDENTSTESIILSKTKLKLIARIPIAEKITSEFIKDQAAKISL